MGPRAVLLTASRPLQDPTCLVPALTLMDPPCPSVHSLQTPATVLPRPCRSLFGLFSTVWSFSLVGTSTFAASAPLISLCLLA